MKPNDILLNEKLKDILKSDKRVIHAEGVTGSSKSFILGIKFFLRVFNSPANHQQFVIAGSSGRIVERMIVDNPASFYNIFKPVCEHKQQGTGGNRIVVNTPSGDKLIYIVGYDNQTTYKSILGLTIHGFLIEEIHTAGEDFLREMWTRLGRDGGFLYTSSNGGLPDLMVYKDYLNRARPHPKYIQDVPKSTLEQLYETPPDDDYEYWFFNFKDNPVKTPEEIEKMYTLHPEGSFEYNSKILGIRGYTEGALYGHLMNNEHIVPFDKLNFSAITDIIVGMDVGSGAIVDGNSKTAVIITAYSRGYQRAVVLDGMFSDQIEHIKVIEEVDEFINKYRRLFGNKVRALYIDSAERTLIETFRANSRSRVQIEGSIKRNKYINAQVRVSMKEQLLLHNRLLFADTKGALMVKEKLSAVKGKNGEMLDEGKDFNDISDALDYSLTPRYHELMRYKGGE